MASYGARDLRIDLAPLEDALRELGEVFSRAGEELAASFRDAMWSPDASPGLCWSDLMAQIDEELAR